MGKGLRVFGHPLHAVLSDFPLALEGLGLLLLSVGGWYAAHLVFHHGIGRDTAEGG